MADLDIIKKVLDQEHESENRYAEQVSRLCDGEIKQTLAQIKEEKRENKEACIALIKEADKKFDEAEFIKPIDMDLNTLLCATLPDIIGYLELDESKECASNDVLKEAIKEVKHDKIKKVLNSIMKNIDSHIEKVSEILRKESID